MDTWAPLYDNPPEGVSWEFWEIGRKYPDNLKFYSESVVIDHIDDDPTNNHLDNLKELLPDVKTVPQIWIGGKHIGGHDQLMEWLFIWT